MDKLSLPRRNRLLSAFGFVPVLLFTLTAISADAESKRAPDASKRKLTFERDVLAIVRKHCLKCHGAKSRKSGLDLRTAAGARKGGESGEQAIVPGHAEKSHLFQLVRTRQMPPKGNTRLTDAEIATFKKWIDSGATGKSGPAEPALTPELLLARKVHFVFELKCYQCHGRKQQKGKLDLRTMRSILKGGKSGPALVPGDAVKSRIVQRIEADQMPPRDVRYKLSIKPVTDPELALIKKWINAGAVPPPPPPGIVNDDGLVVTGEDRQWWAFQPPRRPRVPDVSRPSRVRTAVDAFVAARLKAAGLSFAPDADRRTLIRRISIDLTGLPPSPAEVEAFVTDRAPDAYDGLVDRLLASPRYGETWGQHWLDAAGYADSEGSTASDPIYPNIYRYRDYVVRAINADKPYDQFLLEQLAGDELIDYRNVARMTPEIADKLIATGFLRMCIDPTTSPETNFFVNRYEVLSGTVEIVSSSLMGLTMRCARCHSHKYDPIPHRDYYRFMSIFAAAYAPQNWVKPKERFLVLAGSEERESARKHNAAVDKKLQPLKKELGQLTESFKKRLFDRKLTKLPESIRDDVRKAVETAAGKRNEQQKALVAKYDKQLKVDPKELPKAFPEYKQKSDSLNQTIKATEATRKSLPLAHSLTDMRPESDPFYLLKRGEWNNRGRRVLPNVPVVLTSEKAPFQVKKPWPDAPTTGSRLALARWLTRPNHPLTARVIVNRIWQHHFGTGIVATAGDFGHTGQRPSHPKLLDWLATEFVRQGWSLKKLHRLIVTSTVYRQQSRVRNKALAVDPENRLLWRMPMRRISAEVTRDSILAMSGRLDSKMFGPPTAIETKSDGQVVSKSGPEQFRRSIYTLHRRATPLTVLETFDAPRMITNCIKRRTSTVVSQALLMLNSEWMDSQAAGLAERILREAGHQPAEQLEHAYQLVLGRLPDKAERTLGRQFLQDQTKKYREGQKPGTVDVRKLALADFCLVLLNSAEFLYVD